MSPELLDAVADYMSSTEQIQSLTARKIASLRDSNKELSTDIRNIASAVEALVTKLASAELINDVHAAHLITRAKQHNVSESINKLTTLIEKQASNKMAAAPQLYTVDEASNNNSNNNTSEYDNSWHNRLAVLGRKA